MTLQKLAAFSLALGLAVPTMVEGSEISHSDWSVGTPLDTRGLDGTRLAAAEERIAYDPQWGNAESCSLDANGTRILSGGEAGVVSWSPTGPGLYRLTHTAGNVTYTARFAVPGPETTVVEAGRLETNAVWRTGGVYLVTGTVVVPSGVTQTIESGAVVKFMPGARLAVEAGATCLARGVVFTHAYDDAAGGDTLFDGAETTPVVNDYELTGTITDDETTEYRYTAPLVLSGTISSNTRWRGWKLYHVTGDLTVASGVTLTIEPGAVVKFDAGRSLTVAGGATLDAQGTRAQPIVFTSIKDDGHGGDTNGDGDKTQPQPGDWARINANGTVKMNHCRLYYCSDTGDRGAIQGGGGTVTFDNGEIAHTTYECVRMNSGTFVSHNSVFRDSSMGFGYFGGSGTYVYNGVVADCTIACRASNKHFVNTVFYNCLTFLESASSSTDHCAFYNPPDWGAQTATQVGKNGNIWGDPLFVDPANGDFRIREGSPCVDAADSSAAPELDYFGQPRITFTGRTNDTELAEGPLADIGICEVMPRDVTSDIDLVPEAVRTEKTATPGQLLFVKWEVRNQGGAPVDATWRDTVSLVSQDGREVVLGDKTTKSAIAVGGSVFCSGYFTVPAMAEGTWYPKVNVNSYHDIFEGSLTANNALVGTGGVEVAVVNLDPDNDNVGTLNAGSPRIFKMKFNADESNRLLRIFVPDGVVARWGFGFVPTERKFSGSVKSNGCLSIVVPNGDVEVFIVLEADRSCEYSIENDTGSLEIDFVTPTILAGDSKNGISISGCGFTPGLTVDLVTGTKTIPMEVSDITARSVTAFVDGNVLRKGDQYRLRISNGTGEVFSGNLLQVDPNLTEGHLWCELAVPDNVRQGRLYECRIRYCNEGGKPMLFPVFQVEIARQAISGRLGYKDEVCQYSTLQFVGSGNTPGLGILQGGVTNEISFMYEAGRGDVISLHSSFEKDFHPVEWRSTEEYLFDITQAGSSVARMGKDPTNFQTVYEMARQIRTGTVGKCIVGAVFDTNDNPVSNELVTLTHLETTNEYSMVTGSDGVFCFERLIDGDYRLSTQSATNEYMVSTLGKLVTQMDVFVTETASLNIVAEGESILHAVAVSIGTNQVQTFVGKIAGDGRVRFYGLPDGDYKIECETEDGRRGISFVSVPEVMEIEVEITNTYNLVGNLPMGYTDEDVLLLGVFPYSTITPIYISSNGQFQVDHVCDGDFTLIAYDRRAETYHYVSNSVEGAISFDVSALLQKELTARTSMPRNVIRSVTHTLKSIEFENHFRWTNRDWVEDRLRIARDLLLTRNPRIYPVIPPTKDERCEHSYAKYQENCAVVAHLKGFIDRMQALHDATSAIELWGLWFDALKNAADIALTLQSKGYASLNPKIERAKKATINLGEARAEVYEARVALVEYCIDQGLDYALFDQMDEMLAKGHSSVQELVALFKNPSWTMEWVLSIRSGCKTLQTLLSSIDTVLDSIMAMRGGNPVKRSLFNAYQGRVGRLCGKIKTVVSCLLAGAVVVTDFVIAVDKARERDANLEKMRSLMGPFQAEIMRVDARDFYPYVNCCGKCIPDPPYDPPDGKESPINPQSIDPNEMAGPMGLGDPETERYVKPGEWMTYTVYFENRADATAAAQEVRVTNPLSEYLDWSTFEMGEIAFNNQIDLGLSGKRSGTSEAVMKGTNTLVRTQLTLNEKTGIAEWYLRIVDPTTATGWPEDVFAGFLPPNDETFRGEGHLTYRVKVRDDAPHGVRINNSASIVFDYNEPIETDPSWWNTVARTLEAGFAEPEVAVDEGGTATVAVRGGSAERAVSVQVYLAYQTASAADLDLKNAAVDGATPKGGLRFPLTLSWAAGEIGAKTLTIPVKTDRAVEDDEVFTLQLAGAQGMTVGEADACTVTVRDANAAADYAAKQSKTTVRTKKGVPDCALSVACVARGGSGAVCGYTTGQGSYYAGCRASLRATARPGWAFAGWGEVVDGVTNVVGTKAGWTVTPTNDTEIVALFERIPYVRALADPADGGKVSGSGYCAAGKKVALKATASRNFTFAGWYAAGAPDAPVATTPTLVLDRSAKPAKGDARQTVLADVDGDATYFARFVGDPEVSVTVSATDGRGAEPAGKGAGRYVAGTVTGAGRYAPGKKAVLKATANRGYVFAGWREAGADGTLSRSAAYTIGAMPPDDVALVAAFVTADEDRESVAASLGGLPLAPWVSKTETHALATNVRAGVYLEWPLAASALSETTVKVAGLPAGLRFAAKPVTSRSGTGRSAVLVTNVPANTVYGAPTASSRTVTDRRTGAVTVTPSAVKVTVTTAGRSSRTYQIDATVDPLPAWAQGTFAGVSYADADGAETNGLAAVSVTAAGKVSAKQTAAGRAASFTAPWYDRHDAAEDAYHATLTAKVGAAVVTNRIAVYPAAHAATDAVPAETALGVMRGDLLDAWQTDWRREPWKGFAAALARARPPLACAYEVGGGQPGTVSLKFGANGAVTAAGTFATGVDARGRETTAKASCSATLLPQGGDRYLVFVYFPPKGAFRGHARCLALAWDGAGFVEDVAW